MFESTRSLQDLHAIQNFARRGRKFEVWLAEIFRRGGFRPHHNPGTARPRQSDLLVRRADLDLLVEAKWTRAIADVDIVCALRDRLKRTRQGCVGCLISMSGFSRTAVEDVESNRSQEVILFSEQDVETIAGRPQLLPVMVTRKLDKLRVEGRACLDATPTLGRPVSTKTILPEASEVILTDGEPTASLNFGCEDDVGFVLDAPDGYLQDEPSPAFSLNVRVDVSNLDDLANCLRVIHSALDLQGTSTYAIHQLERTWCGVGPVSLLQELSRWEERYSKTGLTKPHHSENFVFWSGTRYGLVTMSGRQRVRSTNRHGIYSVEVEMIFRGLPVDLGMALTICNDLGVEPGFFTSVQHQWCDRARVSGLTVEPLARIVSAEFDEGVRMLTGLVVRNPFRSITTRPKGRIEYSPLRAFEQPEFLVCRLSDLIGENDVVDKFVLTDVAGAWLAHRLLLQAKCTWGRIVHERCPGSPHGEPSMPRGRKARPAGRTSRSEQRRISTGGIVPRTFLKP